MVRVGDHPNVVSLVGACTRKGRYIQNATDTLFDTPYETQDPTSLYKNIYVGQIQAAKMK